MPARKNAMRQLECPAMATSTSGAAKEPRRLLPKFCITPMLCPRLPGSDSAASSDWHTGMNGPSTRPISSRAANSARNEPARPERNEHSEKAIVQASSIGLRLPVRSDSAPPSAAETAQVNESAEAMRPTCWLVKLRSLAMNGIRKAAALRSKNRKPKVIPSTQTRRCS